MFEDQFKKRQRGTGFTNIQRILNANVGAGQQMAGKISQGIQSAGQNVQQKAQKAQQQFKSAFEQAVNPAMQNIAAGSELAKRSDESQEDYAKRISEANKNYLEIGKNVSQARYGGPMNIQGGKALVGEAQGVSTLGGLAGTGTGQQLLSKQYVAGRQGGYSKGQGALDQLLLGQSREAQKSLQEARQDVSGIGKEVSGIEKAATSDVANIRRQIEQQKSEALKGVQKSIGGLEQAGRESAQQYSKEATRLSDLLKNAKEGSSPIGMVDGVYNDAQAALDMDILKNAPKYGIDLDAKVLSYDMPTVIAGLQEMANKATTGMTTRYTDAQREALKRLTQFQQDQEKATKIGEMENKEAFNVNPENIKKLTPFATQSEYLESKRKEYEDREKFIRQALPLKDSRQAGDPNINELPLFNIGKENIGNEKFIQDAAKILGWKTIERIAGQKIDEATGVFGIRKAGNEAIKDRIRNEVQNQLMRDLSSTQSSYSDIVGKQQSGMSLKDVLSKLYGVK